MEAIVVFFVTLGSCEWIKLVKSKLKEKTSKK